MVNLPRLPFLLISIACLLTGLWTGLSKIGWDIFILSATAHHGAIMVGGFLGTLISLEKIIPLKKKPLFIIPLLSAFSVLFFIVSRPFISISLLILASLGLVVVFVHYLRLDRSLIYALMLGGALHWLIGNIMLLTKNFYPLAFPWWVGFVLFIITAERLELTKFLPVSKFQKKLFTGLLMLFFTGVLFAFHGIGNILCGIALIGVSNWLMRHDLIGVTLSKNGLPKFVAISLLMGYIALLLTGVLFITFSNQWFAYDAIVHTFFIGFVFSMIFAHGPIILPGVIGLSVKPFHKLLYLWLFLLHSSWFMRIFSGAFSEFAWRKTSGLLTAFSILAYFITMAFLIIRDLRNGKVH